jgi:hypothetical protein
MRYTVAAKIIISYVPSQRVIFSLAVSRCMVLKNMVFSNAMPCYCVHNA